MTGAQSQRPLRVFISYSHKDERLRRELETHLAQLEREGLIAHWQDRKIDAGEEWAGAIDTHLAKAEIVLLLISADFIASRYCYDIEMQRALNRHRAGRARVIPIILRAADWHTAPFGKLQALPTEGKPVTSRRPRDTAWLEVATGIRAVARALRTPSAPPARARATTTTGTARGAIPPLAPPPAGSPTATRKRGGGATRAASTSGRPTSSRPEGAAIATERDAPGLDARARALVPPGRHGGEAQLCVALVGGPERRILRPSELEDQALADALLQAALFGPAAIFDRTVGSAIRREGDALVIEQEGASLRIDEAGTVRLLLPARHEGPYARLGLSSLIEEEVRERLERALRLGGTVLNRLDRARHLTDIAVVVALLGGGWLPWRTRADQAANPGTTPMGTGGDRLIVPERPLVRSRAAFARERSALALDLTVLLRRQVRPR